MKSPLPLIPRALLLALTVVLGSCGGGGGGGGDTNPVPTPEPVVTGPAWWGYGRDAQHTAVSGIASQDLTRISWSSPVDLAPQYTTTGALLIHYGSPVVTTKNTVIVPVKTGASGGFRIEARAGSSGAIVWNTDIDYAMPPHRWTPSYNLLLTPGGDLVAAQAGGRLLVRGTPDNVAGTSVTRVFYGNDVYAAAPATYNSTVFINTPVVADAQGNLFFGFQVTGSNPAGLVSGFARVGADGSGRWVSGAVATGDANVPKPALNAAPALSRDGTTVYFAANTTNFTGTQTGYLVALDSTTLATKARVQLLDPSTGNPARVSDDSTAAPAIGNDGRVFYGVLETVFGTHNARGWLLQFDSQLRSSGVPGSFGWDVTPSIIPASMVPSYTGTSSYLLAVKYNNYLGAGSGDGLHRLAILDPTTTQTDRVSPLSVMREVQTILAPTFASGSTTAREEWCINTMAADVDRKSLLVNNEDGVLYRWDLPTNTLTQSIRLTAGLGQAYTPTLIGADGAVYAISNAKLFSITK